MAVLCAVSSFTPHVRHDLYRNASASPSTYVAFACQVKRSSLHDCAMHLPRSACIPDLVLLALRLKLHA